MEALPSSTLRLFPSGSQRIRRRKRIRYWNAIVGNGGEESECGWCKDRWGISWQITPLVLSDAMAAGGKVAKRAFAAMMEMSKIDIAKIEAARCG